MNPGEGERRTRTKKRFTKEQYLNCLFNENWPDGQGRIGFEAGGSQSMQRKSLTEGNANIER